VGKFPGMELKTSVLAVQERRVGQAINSVLSATSGTGKD
jgi:hypothetical protein